MASQQQPMSARDRIRASERALGYNVAQGTQAWAATRRPGLDRPMRSTRLPTPLQAPPPTPVPAAHATAAAQAAEALAAEAEEQPYDDGQQDAGYETEPYEAVGDELEHHQDDNQLRVLTLEEEIAQLRLQIHRLHAELSRQRRIHRQQQELNQLSTGPYWISRTRR